jgi:beta-galactosidase
MNVNPISLGHPRQLLSALLLSLFLAGLNWRASCASTYTSTPEGNLLDFDEHWRFSKGDFSNAMMPAFDDALWQQVDLPHDWSSAGPFGSEYASGNGYAPGGIGWYRKHFKVSDANSNSLIAIEFDGIYDYSEVWLNGQLIGGRPYGYSSFECLLTPLVRFGAENVVAVRVDHSRFADSRWYTGSGIYRRVRLRLTGQLRIAHWGTFVTTPEVAPDSATVSVETTIENHEGQEWAFSLQLELIGPDGRTLSQTTNPGTIADGTNQVLLQRIKIPSPRLWSPNTPTLYTLRSRLSGSDRVTDATTTSFGIRTLKFDPDKGFFLNGSSTKLKGVCLHHDAGCLGAAVPYKVLERRLRILKELGVNAIRTSHNPPAPELLDLCDRLGLMVMDEAFDEFTPAKNKWVNGRNNGVPSRFGYAELFDEWSSRDVSDMVRRDRNHPSVIMWSIGNEIDYRNDPFTHPVLGNEFRPGSPRAERLVTCARPLVAAVKTLDPTRPVTAALATVAMSNAVGLPELLDVVGYNYQESRYTEDHQKYPGRFIYGSENSGGWTQWLAVTDQEFVGGQFLWTGIDYLGEANRWPNRGSGAGLLDLCGFKKPSAWLRQSLWSDKPMVYLFTAESHGSSGRGVGGGFGRFGGQESWNWPSNALMTVRCCTTCPEVVLLLNGRPLGTNRLSEARQGLLTWQVPFEPGVLKAIGRKDGSSICEFSLRTAGPAQRIELLPETRELRADGRDICHVEFFIVDTQGVRVPDAAPEITFTADGQAKILGIENGDLNSPATGKDGARKAYHGRGLVIVQSLREPGKALLTARASGLGEATVEIQAKP